MSSTLQGANSELVGGGSFSPIAHQQQRQNLLKDEETKRSYKPSVFDTKGSDTSGHLFQAQISPLQEWVPRWDGTSLSLVMCQVLWLTSQRRTLGCSHKRSHKPSWNAVSPLHGQHQGTFSFTFLGRWLSFTALEACCVKLSQASNHSHHPSPKMLVSGVHPHTHCCRMKSWLLAAKLPAPCPASLHVHRGLREGPKQIRLS